MNYKGRKGAQGGYNLVKQSEITIGEILKALEGENIFIDVNSHEENELENFINKNLWSNINNLIDDYLESITLEDLVNDHEKQQRTGFTIYKEWRESLYIIVKEGVVKRFILCKSITYSFFLYLLPILLLLLTY